MFAASPVTASIAVTSLETIFSAVRFSSTFWVLSCWSLFLHPASVSAAPAMRMKARIGVSPRQSKKEAAGTYRQPLEKPTPPMRGRLDDYIALLVVVVFVVVVAFMSVAFMLAFMSVAFMSLVVAFMSVVVRFSSTFMVLLPLSLLLHTSTARAAPATRIRARIQDSLFIAI